MNVYDKLEELSITLPEVSPPAAAFVPFVRTGTLIFLAGHIAKKNGKPWSGSLGTPSVHRKEARPHVTLPSS